MATSSSSVSAASDAPAPASAPATDGSGGTGTTKTKRKGKGAGRPRKVRGDPVLPVDDAGIDVDIYSASGIGAGTSEERRAGRPISPSARRASASSADNDAGNDPANLQRYYRTELLNPEEEYRLGVAVRLITLCEQVHEGLHLEYLRPPDLDEWAAACGYTEEEEDDGDVRGRGGYDRDGYYEEEDLDGPGGRHGAFDRDGAYGGSPDPDDGDDYVYVYERDFGEGGVGVDGAFSPELADAEIRPVNNPAADLLEKKDPYLFEGPGLAGKTGVGRGNGRARKPPPVKLDDYYDDADRRFSGGGTRASRRGGGENDGADAPPPVLVNRGTVRDFAAMMMRGREAKRRMVQCNMRLVVSIAKRYRNVGVNVADLVQEGSIGLTRAAEKFDPGRGFKFSTYASW